MNYILLNLTEKFKIIMLVFCLSFALATPPAAHADAMTDLACAVKNYMTGTIMQIIVLIGVIGLGIGLFLGKVQMPVFIMFVAAIGVIFGAATIVDALVKVPTGSHGLAACTP